MHYVKEISINGIDTRQAGCIELHGKPNAATEGIVGVLGIDVDSPTHEVYKCVAVKGSIYTWELLSSGMSTITAIISYQGTLGARFGYDSLNTPVGYVVKRGDLIIDAEGYVYQVASIDSQGCYAIYCEMCILPKKGIDYYTEADKKEMVDIVTEGAMNDIEAALEQTVQSGAFNGKDGVDGKDGIDGYTPQKGVDYWTPEDEVEIKSYIDAQFGDVDAALDRIIAIQNGLSGIDAIITFSIVGRFDSTINFAFAAKKGMTWGEWIESEYNTIGAYASSYDWVYFPREDHLFIAVYDEYDNRVDLSDEARTDEVIIDGYAYQAVGF